MLLYQEEGGATMPATKFCRYEERGCQKADRRFHRGHAVRHKSSSPGNLGRGAMRVHPNGPEAMRSHMGNMSRIDFQES